MDFKLALYLKSAIVGGDAYENNKEKHRKKENDLNTVSCLHLVYIQALR